MELTRLVIENFRMRGVSSRDTVKAKPVGAPKIIVVATHYGDDSGEIRRKIIKIVENLGTRHEKPDAYVLGIAEIRRLNTLSHITAQVKTIPVQFYKLE